MSDIIIIFADSYSTLAYHPDTNIIHHTVHQPIGGAELRKLLDEGLEVLKKYKATKWLSDNRKIGIMNEADTEWINNDWTPRAIGAGWQYWALVVPDDILARMDITKFVDATFDRGMREMVFANPDEAMEWLVTIDK